MIADEDIATHEDPVWRDKTNYILRIDLTPHGLPGKAEQLWTRTEDKVTFELCCIPFFTYGFALGDRIEWSEATDTARLVEPSGRRNIRIAWLDAEKANEHHESLHGELLTAGALVEFRSSGYAAIDCGESAVADRVRSLLVPRAEAGDLLWEYGDEPLTEGTDPESR